MIKMNYCEDNLYRPFISEKDMSWRGLENNCEDNLYKPFISEKVISWRGLENKKFTPHLPQLILARVPKPSDHQI